MTVPVRDRSVTFEDVHDAAKASTACTAMYKPAQLKDSNIISAVFSRFSGGFKGYRKLVSNPGHVVTKGKEEYRFSQKKIVVLWFDSEIFEDGVGPEPLHMVPILDLAVTDRIMDSVPRPSSCR
jgi:hypothetical protein